MWLQINPSWACTKKITMETRHRGCLVTGLLVPQSSKRTETNRHARAHTDQRGSARTSAERLVEGWAAKLQLLQVAVRDSDVSRQRQALVEVLKHTHTHIKKSLSNVPKETVKLACVTRSHMCCWHLLRVVCMLCRACFSSEQHKTMYPAESTHIPAASKITRPLLLLLPETTKNRSITILWKVKIRGGLLKCDCW